MENKNAEVFIVRLLVMIQNIYIISVKLKMEE